MRYCPNCGSEQRNDASFCSFCGKELSNSKETLSSQARKDSDPSLTKNIVLISMCVLLILLSTIIGNRDGSIQMESCIMLLFVAGALAFFAIRPSADHIDTIKMDLLKTIESFSISIVCFVFAFFTSDYIVQIHLAIASFFALMTVLKIKEIDIMSRKIIEKILLALSIVLLTFSSIEFFGFFIFKIFSL